MARTRNPSEIETQMAARVAPRPQKPSTYTLIPTGNTLLNLLLSGNMAGGWGSGKMVNIIGDSQSGKTLLCLNTFAEVNTRPDLRRYRFIYDDVEQACEFDISRLFGEGTSRRIEPPARDPKTKEPRHSETIEDFERNLYRAIDAGPFIYVLDCLDALTSLEEKKRTELQIAGKKAPGSMGMEKPKKLTEILRKTVSRIKHSDGLLIIISQTRENLDPMSFEKKTRAGGKALKFYASHELWMACGVKRKKNEMVIGVDSIIKCTKNKLNGKAHRSVTVPLYYEYGMDDVGASVDWLCLTGHWHKAESGGMITCPEFHMKGNRAAVIQKVESENREQILREIVQAHWDRIEDSLKMNRKRRYE